MRLDPAGVRLLNRGRRAVRARFGLAAVSGLALLLAAGCSTSGSPGGAVSSTVVIAAVPGVSDAAIYLAQKDGLFAAEGLTHVRIDTYQNQGQVLAALETAHADIAASDYGSVFSAQAQRSADLRILADGYDATAGSLEILTLPTSKIHNPAELIKSSANPGLAIGVPSDDWLHFNKQGSSSSLDVAAASDVLKSFVGNAASSVTWDSMSQQTEVSELHSGQLQAILVSEPYVYQAESQLGAVAVMDACSGNTAGLPLLGYVALNAWVKQNPSAVADFQAALAKAQAHASLAGQVQGVLHSAAKMTVQDADLITVGTYPESTSTQSLQNVINLMSGEGVFKGAAPNLKKMLVGS
jgi:NitT/TauT family transport system substrate-binding protein